MSSFGRLVCSVAEWVPHSTVLASGVDSLCGPLANEGVGLGPSSSGQVVFRPPLGYVCFGGLAGDIFHLGVAMRGFPRMVGLLAALLEVCLPGSMTHFSPERVVMLSGSGIVVRALLLATSLPLTMVLPLTPGRFVHLGLFRMVRYP